MLHCVFIKTYLSNSMFLCSHWNVFNMYAQMLSVYHTGQCKRTGCCHNELVVAFFSTDCGVKGKKYIPVD